MFRCLDLFPALFLPFDLRSVALLLSWYYRILSLTSYPCALRNSNVHNSGPTTLSAATTSASVELRVLMPCFLEIEDIAPRPILNVAPMWPLKSGILPSSLPASTSHSQLGFTLALLSTRLLDLCLDVLACKRTVLALSQYETFQLSFRSVGALVINLE